MFILSVLEAIQGNNMTQPATNPSRVSDYLLYESRKRGELLTNLKLQKLLYYADAWFLALKDRLLFEERFQAWVHGPVLVSEYHRFKDYQWRPIDCDVAAPELSDESKAHLDEITDLFGCETAVALELMTHREKPWIEARGGCADTDPCNNYISMETTRDFYRAL